MLRTDPFEAVCSGQRTRTGRTSKTNGARSIANELAIETPVEDTAVHGVRHVVMARLTMQNRADWKIRVQG